MIEKQEPIVWVVRGQRGLHLSTVYTRQEADYWTLHGATVTAYFTTPLPCPECEKLKAELDLTKTLAQQSNQDHLNARLDYQGEIIGLKAERDELAVQVEKMRKDIQRHCRYINSDYESCCGICGNKLTEEHHPDCSMSLPDISTSILNSVRAKAGKC